MRRACAFIFPLLFMFASTCPAVPNIAMGRDSGHPWDYKRVYYLIEYQGRLREKGFFVRRPGSYQRQSCVIYDEEKTSNADLNGLPVTRVFRSKTITTPRGDALYRHEEALAGESGSETVVVQGGAAEIRGSGYFGGSATIPTPAGALFEISGDWLAANNPQSGRNVQVDILDRENRRVTRETVTFGDRVQSGSRFTPDLWLAEFSTRDEAPMRARFTADGRLLRLESAGLVYQVVTREEYEEGRAYYNQPTLFADAYDDAPDPFYPSPDYGQPNYPSASQFGTGEGYAPSIPIGASIPGWDNFAWLVIQAGPPGMWDRYLATSEYAQIDNNAGYLSITALRNAPRVDVNIDLPMSTPSDVQPFLGSHPLIPTQNSTIIQSARAAVADADTRRQENNALRAVSYLAGWINQEIAFDPRPDFQAGAVDVLRARRADSLGHARLFVAMARSLGIPSRACQGLLVQTGRAVFHAWAEAWIGGVWVPIDTTVSRVGLPAGYVMVERSGPDAALNPEFADFLLTPGLSLTMLSAGRETPMGSLAEMVAGDRRTYAAYEGDWLANLYWGFAMRLPAGWDGRARINSVDVVSPDRLANVRCEALEGDFRAGQAELDSNIENLRLNLSQFRLIDGRLVSFDAEGATPALFMDFVCEQNGSQLRCRQYVLPRRQRAFRISFWAPAGSYDSYVPYFDSIIASFEY